MKSSLENDPIVASLLPGYFNNLSSLLTQMNQAFETANIKSMAHLAHTIKGSSSCYGYNQIAAMAGLIETACSKDAEKDNLSSYIDSLRDLVNLAITAHKQ